MLGFQLNDQNSIETEILKLNIYIQQLYSHQRISVFVVAFCLYSMIGLFFTTADAQSVRMQEGIHWYQSGEYGKAIDLLEQVIEHEPMRSRAHLVLISSYLETGEAPLAERKAIDALDLFPSVPAFQWLLAEALLKQNKFTRSLEIYTEVNLELKQGRSLDPLRVDVSTVRSRMGQVHQALAAEEYREGRPERAIQRMSRAVELLQDSLQVHKNLAVLYLEDDRYEGALQSIDHALERFPGEMELLRMKASVYYQMEDQQALLEQFGQIYENEPQNVENGLIYAELLIASQRSDDGVEVLEKLLEQFPEDKRIYRMMAELNERRFNTEGKRVVLREMQKQFPEDYSVLEQIAVTYEREKKWSHARAVYDSLATATGDEISYMLSKADTYEAQDSLSAATDLLRSLKRSYPRDEIVLFRLGDLFEKQEQWENAAEVYHLLVSETNEKSAEALTRLGIVLRESGNEEDALRFLHKAIDSGTDNPEAHLALSQLMHVNRKSAESFEPASRALQQSLQQMANSQRTLEASIQQEGIHSQYDNTNRVRDLEKLNLLAEESFEWFTGNYNRTDIEPVLQDLLERYQVSGRLFYMTGTYYRKLGEDNQSLEYFEKAVRYAPKLVEAHLERAEIYEANEQTRQAIAAYERAGALTPESSKPYEALIRLYRKQGELDRLCDRWLARYRAKPGNKVLEGHLIEALHRADRFAEANEIINN